MERGRRVARTKAEEAEGGTDDARTAAQRGDAAGYTVVARRYRPQRFSEMVGQDHVVQALRNAVTMNRVTHAYLFAGTRGVGKTSIARIFAKCLNCVTGPTVTPCNVCDVCRAISVGQDVDVIEIDGASSNGVEDVRNLRQNAGLRPSRGRFKIYYIDEVHMLSTGAFNALLKTLEEPPEHLKFFFATTEPNKIPITVLSRCQRFDFAGITAEQIAATLAEICTKEQMKAEPAALATIARRASGSMRDAQSLLEQMLSYGGASLTEESVHRALGIAPDDRLLDLIDALADRDLARVLGLVESSVSSGVQAADLLTGTLGFLRDLMVTQVGPDVPLLYAAPSQKDRLRRAAERMPLDTTLAALQILSDAKGRLRFSPDSRFVVELALARVARLEDFAELGELIARLDGGAAPVKKKSPDGPLARGSDVPERGTAPGRARPVAVPASDRGGPGREEPAPPNGDPQPVPPNRAEAGPPLRLDQALATWRDRLADKLPFRLRMTISRLLPSAVEPPGVLVVPIPARYNGTADECDAARDLIERALSELLGRTVSVRFVRGAPGSEDDAAPEPAKPSATRVAETLAADPWVQDVMRTFETAPFPFRVDNDEEPPAR